MLARILDADPERTRRHHFHRQPRPRFVDADGLPGIDRPRAGRQRAADQAAQGTEHRELVGRSADQLDSMTMTMRSVYEDADEASTEFTLADLEGVHVLNPWLIRGSSDPDAAVPADLFSFDGSRCIAVHEIPAQSTRELRHPGRADTGT